MEDLLIFDNSTVENPPDEPNLFTNQNHTTDGGRGTRNVINHPSGLNAKITVQHSEQDKHLTNPLEIESERTVLNNGLDAVTNIKKSQTRGKQKETQALSSLDIQEQKPFKDDGITHQNENSVDELDGFTDMVASVNGELNDIDDPDKQRRLKWIESEIETLWNGIFTFGNEWREIQKTLPGRTYHQVKDKGRRLLHKHGWSTGRTKTYSEGAKEEAKSIAQSELSKLSNKKGKTLKRGRSGISGPANANGVKKTIAHRAKRHIASIPRINAKQKTVLNNVFGVPKHDLFYVGMHARVESLRLGIAKGAKDFRDETTTVQIVGDYGMGKSSLVNDYIHKFQDFYTGGIFWIDASLISKLRAELNLMANDWLKVTAKEEKSVEKLIQTIWKSLETRSKWLLVFDAVENAKVFKYICPPPSLRGKGTVLITCEEFDKSLKNISEIHRVPALTHEECVSMLQDLVGIPESKLTKPQKKSFEKFIDDSSVKGMPAAVRITAFYLAKYGIRNTKKFVENVQKLREEMDLCNHSKYFAGRILLNTNANLYDTFGRSNLIQALWQTIRPKLSLLSTELLEVCSLLCPNGISAGMLVKAISEKSLAAEVANAKRGSKTAAAVQALSDLSLINYDGDKGLIYMSTCIQTAVIQTLVQEERFFETAEKVFRCFDSIYSSMMECRLVPHVTAVLKRVKHFEEFDAPKSNPNRKLVDGIKKYGSIFRKYLVQDGIRYKKIISALEAPITTGKFDGMDITGDQIVSNVEAILKESLGDSSCSALAQTFITQA